MDRTPGVNVRRSSDRAVTRLPWLESKHSFSFGRHYDPGNTHHGLLLVNNDDVVAPGSGFEEHPHADLEIVTWVLQGALVHQDSTGHAGVVYPGLAQRMSAGRGILHSEKNDAWRLEPERSSQLPVRFVQMWVRPDESGIDPSYEQREIDAEQLRGRLVPVASGRARHAAAISIRNRSAALYAARLSPGDSVALPEAPYVHLYLASGAVTMEGVPLADTGRLAAGDAVRLTAGGGQRVTAVDGAEILVWEMHARI